jgi:DNA (cytosine-5)-methyltransferase 1
MAFEEEGFCIVRGPDLLWGGDIRNFHPPAGKFDGGIGGPPCQHWSRLSHMVRHRYGDAAVAPDLIPEFERCVFEAQPTWFLMENVLEAPVPSIDGYAVSSLRLNNRWVSGVQNRVRRFSFGVRGTTAVDLVQFLDVTVFEPLENHPAILASGGARECVKGDFPKTWRMRHMGDKTTGSLKAAIKYQGLPEGFLAGSPLTIEGKCKAVGNGVPLPMGRAIAKAVKRATSGR